MIIFPLNIISIFIFIVFIAFIIDFFFIFLYNISNTFKGGIDMKLENYAGHCTSMEFNAKMKQKRGVILVCGSCEQHGHHLPLDTDNIIGFETALRIAQNTDMLVMPPILYGQVWSAKGFPGTICLKPDTLKQILREITENLHQQGARHIVLLSGHNGNYSILKELARDLLDDYGWENIWHFPLTFPKSLEKKAASPAPKVAAHAGELETSMVLHYRPDLVSMEQAACEFPEPPEDYLYRPMHWNTFLSSGSFGDSGAATAETGEELCNEIVAHISELICRLLK